MVDPLLPHPLRQPTYHSRQLLREIADALGVGVEAFLAESSPFLFYADAKSNKWLLVSGADGLPSIRVIGGDTEFAAIADEPVALFLSRNINSAQGNALAALINSLLLAHMR